MTRLAAVAPLLLSGCCLLGSGFFKPPPPEETEALIPDASDRYDFGRIGPVSKGDWVAYRRDGGTVTLRVHRVMDGETWIRIERPHETVYQRVGRDGRVLESWHHASEGAPVRQPLVAMPLPPSNGDGDFSRSAGARGIQGRSLPVTEFTRTRFGVDGFAVKETVAVSKEVPPLWTRPSVSPAALVEAEGVRLVGFGTRDPEGGVPWQD